MAIVSFSKKFIFVHVPKTAGTSVTKSLVGYCDSDDIVRGSKRLEQSIASTYSSDLGVKKHSTANEIKQAVGDKWDQFFKFAIVRNPYSRAYSLFKFLKNKFRDWEGSEIMNDFNSFSDFVHSDFFMSDGPNRILRPQVFWLQLESPGSSISMSLDFIGRLENLQSDFEKIDTVIHENLGQPIDRDDLKLLNSSSGVNEWEEYVEDASVRNVICDKFSSDFELLNYRP